MDLRLKEALVKLTKKNTEIKKADKEKPIYIERRILKYFKERTQGKY